MEFLILLIVSACHEPFVGLRALSLSKRLSRVGEGGGEGDFCG